MPERLPSACAIHVGRLEHLMVLGLEGREQDDEHERDPLPGVADDHGDSGGPRVRLPRVLLQAKGGPDRLEGSLDRVGHHPVQVTDPDRRDGQWDEEHDPEEAAAGQVLDREHRQAQSDRVLERDAPERRRSSVTTRAPGRPPSAVSVWASSHVKPTSMMPAARRTTSEKGPTPERAPRLNHQPASTMLATTSAQPRRLGGLSTPRKWVRSVPEAAA